MDRLPNDKPYLIYLTHQDKEFEKKLEQMIMSKIRNVEVRIFKQRSDILIEHDAPNADLIILDLLFDDHPQLDRAENALKNLADRHSPPPPFLVIVNAECFDHNKINFVNTYPDVYFDFIDQDHFFEFIFINRIKVLLSIPKILKLSKYQKGELQRNLWMALDYSNLFIVILDEHFKVLLTNYQLAKTLGFENEDVVIGHQWTEFLTPVEDELIQHVFGEILKGNKAYEEFTNDIIPITTKKPITVKWFNTYINNNFNCSFSIGLPITKEPNINADVESVRAYFTDILKKDRTTINAMKEVTMKYSQQILGKQNNKEGEC